MDQDTTTPRLVYRGEQDILGSGLIGETKRVDSQQELAEALKDGWRLTSVDPADEPRARDAARTAEADKAQGHRDAVKLAAAAQARAKAEAEARQPVAEAQAANDAAKAEIARTPKPKPDAAKAKADAQAEADGKAAAKASAAPKRNALKK